MEEVERTAQQCSETLILSSRIHAFTIACCCGQMIHEQWYNTGSHPLAYVKVHRRAPDNGNLRDRWRRRGPKVLGLQPGPRLFPVAFLTG
jgi:hypothetical protein